MVEIAPLKLRLYDYSTYYYRELLLTDTKIK